MGSVRFDDARFPLVVVTFEGPIPDLQFDDYLQRMTRLLERRKKMVTVLDARLSDSPPPRQRARQAEWLKTNRALLQQFSCGSVFVIKSALIRGALTAILWISPMPVAHAVVSTPEDAERWALDRLREAGVPLPPGAPTERRAGVG